MPCDYSKYPPNWKTEIVPTVAARAGEQRDRHGNILVEARCEKCRLRNHTYYHRFTYGSIVKCSGPDTCPFCYDHRSTMIVLTCAHLDHTPETDDPEMLRAWCQRCHLRYDATQHAETRRRTREAASDQGLLFELTKTRPA